MLQAPTYFDVLYEIFPILSRECAQLKPLRLDTKMKTVKIKIYLLFQNNGERGGQRETIKVSTHAFSRPYRSEEHTSELQSRFDLVCRLLLEKKKKIAYMHASTHPV